MRKVHDTINPVFVFTSPVMCLTVCTVICICSKGLKTSLLLYSFFFTPVDLLSVPPGFKKGARFTEDKEDQGQITHKTTIVSYCLMDSPAVFNLRQ